jgi:hypothetical protein
MTEKKEMTIHNENKSIIKSNTILFTMHKGLQPKRVKIYYIKKKSGDLYSAYPTLLRGSKRWEQSVLPG